MVSQKYPGRHRNRNTSASSTVNSQHSRVNSQHEPSITDEATNPAQELRLEIRCNDDCKRRSIGQSVSFSPGQFDDKLRLGGDRKTKRRKTSLQMIFFALSEISAPIARGAFTCTRILSASLCPCSDKFSDREEECCGAGAGTCCGDY